MDFEIEFESFRHEALTSCRHLEDFDSRNYSIGAVRHSKRDVVGFITHDNAAKHLVFFGEDDIRKILR